MAEHKERFAVLINYCMHPEQFDLAKYKPILHWAFTGPTRTGKTFMVYALCGEIEKMLRASGSPLKFRYLNIPGSVVAAGKLSGILQWAYADLAPCVIFIDEFDLCSPQRGGDKDFVLDALNILGNDNHKVKCDPKKPVITVIATNKIENIDTPLLRRIGGEEIRFEYPCINDRIEYIGRMLQKSGSDINKFYIKRLAQKVQNKSFEDMARFIINAQSKSLVYNIPLSQELLEHCINEDLRHIIFFNRKLFPPKEMMLLSAHYAGAALALALLQETEVLDMVTINAFMPKIMEEHNTGIGRETWQPKILIGKLFTRNLGDTTGLLDRQQILKRIKCLVAGAMAEEIIFGYPSSNMCEQESLSEAYEWAKHITFGGIWKGQLANAVYDELSKQALALFLECKKEVKALLEEHREQLDALIYALINHPIHTLSDDDVYAIMGNPKAIYQIDEQEQQAA